MNESNLYEGILLEGKLRIVPIDIIGETDKEYLCSNSILIEKDSIDRLDKHNNEYITIYSFSISVLGPFLLP